MKRAFTLLEMTVSMTVLAVVAAVVVPVINGAADTFASACGTREAAGRAAFAIDRCVRLLRDTPAGAVPGQLDIVGATPTSITFSDGRGLALTDDVLYLKSKSGDSALCRGVESFSISVLGPDGITNLLGTPALAQRFVVSIKTGGVELRCAATPRAGVMSP